MRRAALLLLIALAAGPAWPADLTIEGPAATPRDKLVKLRAGGADPNAALLWRVTPAVDRADAPPDRLQFAGGEATYRIELVEITVDGGKPKVREAFAEHTVGRVGTEPPPIVPPPTPPPPVPPVPPVTPPVKPAGYYFLVVRPDAPSTPEFTRLISSPAWAGLTAAGHKFGVMTESKARAVVGFTNPVGPDGRPLLPLPVVLTLRTTPDGRRSVQAAPLRPLPATSEGITALPIGLP